MSSDLITYSVRDLCEEIVGGGTPSTKVSHFWKGSIPWISSSDISDDGNIEIRRFISDEAIKNSATNLVPKGTVIVVSRVGVGKAGIAPKDLCFSQDCQGLILKQKIINENYFIRAIQKSLLFLVKKARGATITGVTKEEIKNLKIVVPKKEDQIRIANILSKAEALISQRKESLRLLDEFLKSTFLEMFGDPVRNEKQKKISLSELVEVQSGQVDPRIAPYKSMLHVGGANIESETGKLSNLNRAEDENLVSGKYLFKAGTVLYSKIRPYLNKVAIPNFDGICSADIYPLLPSNRINKHFLRYTLMSKDFLAYTSKHSERTNIPKVNRESLLNYNVSVPSISLQARFELVVEKTEALKARYQTSLQELENLYGSLSQRAFSPAGNLLKAGRGELSFDEGELSMAAEPKEKYRI